MKMIKLPLCIFIFISLSGCVQTLESRGRLYKPQASIISIFEIKNVTNPYKKALDCTYSVVGDSRTISRSPDWRQDEDQKFSLTYNVKTMGGVYGLFREDWTVFVYVRSNRLILRYTKQSNLSANAFDNTHFVYKDEVEAVNHSSLKFYQCVSGRI